MSYQEPPEKDDGLAIQFDDEGELLEILPEAIRILEEGDGVIVDMDDLTITPVVDENA